MKNKGFSLIELVVVITIISIIMLIGVPAFAQITERMKIRSDRASASEIGKALVVREELVPVEEKIEYYPTITRCDTISNINEYVSKEHKPQSLEDGYFFATAIEVNNIKKILVGIGKDGMTITNKVYNGPEALGWAFVQSYEVNEFLEQNKDLLSEAIVIPKTEEN